MSKYLTIVFLAAASIAAPGSLRADLGGDSPGGTSGRFNGNVTSGGSYDPYTGNATRSITDIVVAGGGVSAYPLAFTRTMNSRYYVSSGVDAVQFGEAGTWRHSYQWTITSPNSVGEESLPTEYVVTKPDGRRLIFSGTGNPLRAGPGIADRLVPLTYADPSGENYCTLLLPDGGQILFKVQFSRGPSPSYTTTWSYSLLLISDPHGLSTTVEPSGSYLTTIRERGGRWLELHYGDFHNGTSRERVLDRVVGSDGRTVQYRYSAHWTGGRYYTALTSVEHFGDGALTAWHGYQNDNTSRDGRPLIAWCEDTMYSGAMWKIAYEFLPRGQGGVYGQLLREKHHDGTPVSSLSVNGSSRTETRGDGAVRTFNYSGGRLYSWTDFKGVSASQTFDGNGYINSGTDFRGHRTDFARDPLTGNVTFTTHPATATEPNRASAQVVYGHGGCHDPNNRDANNPYYVCATRDERNHWTLYWRDGNKRVTKIEYPNGAWEEFRYTAQFGQLEWHRQTNGGIATAGYDAYGLKRWSTNADGKTTNYNYHYLTDWLWHVQDPRLKNSWRDYNSRGQMVQFKHDDQTTLLYGYHREGTLAWSADERHPGAAWDANQRNRFEYDDYKRLRFATNLLNQRTEYRYERWGRGGSHTHTRSFVFRQVTPMGKTVDQDCDDNFRAFIKREAPGTADDAMTWFEYDQVGNLTRVQSPKGPATNYSYDERNRRTSQTDPWPFNGQVMRWEYDATSNMTKEIRPDGANRRWEYDQMNRVVQTYGFANEGTGYRRDHAGNVRHLIDAKGAWYDFNYDGLNRKKWAQYPPDISNLQRYETWDYDAAGNMIQYRNPAGQMQTITYDNRNRPDIASWSNQSARTVNTDFDAAGRLTGVFTTNAGAGNDTAVTFGYDEANRQIWEDQTLQHYPTRRVETLRDGDGNRANVHVPGHYQVFHHYTQRNQLWRVDDGNRNPFFSFSHDVNGNLTQRRGHWWSPNTTNLAYDELDRNTMVEQTGWNEGVFARNWQQYDSLSRLSAQWRQLEGDRGERYGYDAQGQLTRVDYNARDPWSEGRWGWDRTVTYHVDALNRWQVDENGAGVGYQPNWMNQYVEVGGQRPNYDDKLNLHQINGWTYSYDAEKRLIAAGNPGERARFTYDGFGRCVRRKIDTETILFTYDGWKPVVEWNENGGFRAWNVYGAGPDEILMRYQAGVGELVYKLDRQGNVMALLNSAGHGIERYSYDAFGQPTVTDWYGENPRSWSRYGNRFMFTGREWLPALGLYDYRHRMYHPQLGRFLQPDPLGFAAGDANLFRYCGGDPVNKVDPTGLVDAIFTAELKRPEQAGAAGWGGRQGGGGFGGTSTGGGFAGFSIGGGSSGSDAGSFGATEFSLSSGISLSPTLAPGVGPVLNRTFTTTIVNPAVTAQQLAAEIRNNINSFAASTNPLISLNFTPMNGAPTMIMLGNTYFINIPGPWNGSVQVSNVTASTFSLTTLPGHPEAGSISFGAFTGANGSISFEINSVFQSSSGLSSLGSFFGGQAVQTAVWMNFSNNVIRASGGQGTTSQTTTSWGP